MQNGQDILSKPLRFYMPTLCCIFNLQIMKQLYILFLIIFVISSCKKEEPCNYNIEYWASDTSLFISYEMDNEKFTYYQAGEDYGPFSTSYLDEYDENNIIAIYNLPVSFGEIYNRETSFTNTNVSIEFWNYSVYNKNLEPNYQLLSETIEDYNSFCYPLLRSIHDEFSISDTIYMKGISLQRFKYLYSTAGVMSYFNYNMDSIQDFFNTSHFTISNMESVCNNYYLVEGTFETKIINYDEPFDIKHIKNGQFRFIVR